MLLLANATLAAPLYPFIPIAGSPKNIEHIIQDHRGRIWIATLQDVLSFDGARFFSLHDSGFPITTTFSLSEDDEGGILIGSQNGAYRFFRGRLEKLPPDVIAARVTSVAPGLLIVSGSPPGKPEPSAYRVRRARGVWEAAELTGWPIAEFRTRDPNGAILSACPGGWCEYPAQLIANWTPGQPPAPIVHRTSIEVRNVLRDRSGCLWFRTLESAAYQCQGGSSPVPLPAPVAGRNVWAGVEETGDGRILFANAASLSIGRGKSFQVVTQENGLPSETMTCAIQAKDGAIWVGSIGGLYRFPHPFQLSYWKSPYGPVWSIAKSRGRMFAGTSAGIATLGDDGDWRLLPATQGLGSISSLLPEPDGNLYGAVSGKTVIHLRMPTGVIDARVPGGSGFRPQFLARSADGGIWVAGAGFFQLIRKGGELLPVARNPDGTLPPDPFLASDQRGGLWGCFSGALIHRQAQGWDAVARGTPTGLCRSLAFPNGEEVWMGYNTASALVLLHGGVASQIRRYTIGRDAGAALGYTFGTDNRGWLWRGSLDGMFAATGQQALHGVWNGLGDADGLTNVDVNHNSFFSDPDGSVWWAADTAVFHFAPPADFVEPPGAPRVFVSSFSAGGQATIPADTAGELPFRRKLTVHLASLQFDRRNAVRVRSRLLPEQKDWRELNTLDWDLGSPAWGKHTLEFQSRFNTGRWSATSSWKIAVARPWWFTAPALLAFTGIGFAGAAGGLAWRKKSKRRASSQLPQIDAWRAAILIPESRFIGVTLDRRFHVLQVIARGGFATVFRGRDLLAERFCAIKILRRESVDEEWVSHRFQQELAALEHICHPSVVAVYAHGLAPGGAPTS